MDCTGFYALHQIGRVPSDTEIIAAARHVLACQSCRDAMEKHSSQLPQDRRAANKAIADEISPRINRRLREDPETPR